MTPPPLTLRKRSHRNSPNPAVPAVLCPFQFSSALFPSPLPLPSPFPHLSVDRGPGVGVRMYSEGIGTSRSAGTAALVVNLGWMYEDYEDRREERSALCCTLHWALTLTPTGRFLGCVWLELFLFTLTKPSYIRSRARAIVCVFAGVVLCSNIGSNGLDKNIELDQHLQVTTLFESKSES